MSEEGYNGWSNRETWAVNLWLSNDQGLYSWTRERVAEALENGSSAGEAVRLLVDELTDLGEQLMTPEQIVSFLRDVGSLWRVDWSEVGAAWVEDAS